MTNSLSDLALRRTRFAAEDLDKLSTTHHVVTKSKGKKNISKDELHQQYGNVRIRKRLTFDLLASSIRSMINLQTFTAKICQSCSRNDQKLFENSRVQKISEDQRKGKRLPHKICNTIKREKEKQNQNSKRTNS